MNDSVLFDIKGPIATLTLNRPHVMNAFNGEMIRELTSYFQTLHKDDTLRALIIKGAGSSFCAGADISWMKDSQTLSPEENLKESQELSELLYLLDTLPMPTLCLVQGSVRGGGTGLVACSDIAIATPDATFSFSETRIGLVPALIAPYVLRAIGPRSARRYFLTGEVFNAKQAHFLGLVHDISPNADPQVSALLKGGPEAIRKAKEHIRQINGGISEETLQMTTQLLAETRLSEEAQNGFQAFLDKRPPPWSLEND